MAKNQGKTEDHCKLYGKNNLTETNGGNLQFIS